MRNVICIKCRVIRKSNDPNPYCDVCNNIMITTIKSIITGEVMNSKEMDIALDKDLKK